jgi:hypothetical protein
LRPLRALVPVIVLGVSPLSAQGFGLDIGAGLAALRLQNTTSVGSGVLSGVAPAALGSVSVGRFALEGSYLEGTLAPSGSSTLASQDLVDGALFLSAKPTSFIDVKGGIHARSYVTSGGTERWVFWEGRAHGEAPLGPGVRAYAEVWRAFSTEAVAPLPLDQAQGGEAGLKAMVSRFELRLSYGIDDARSGGGVSRQTVETFLFAVSTRIP